MVAQSIEKAAADTAACDAKFTAITTEHIDRTNEWQHTNESRLDTAEVRPPPAPPAAHSTAHRWRLLSRPAG